MYVYSPFGSRLYLAARLGQPDEEPTEGMFAHEVEALLFSSPASLQRRESTLAFGGSSRATRIQQAIALFALLRLLLLLLSSYQKPSRSFSTQYLYLPAQYSSNAYDAVDSVVTG